jgi:hypothetical protein
VESILFEHLKVYKTAKILGGMWRSWVVCCVRLVRVMVDVSAMVKGHDISPESLQITRIYYMVDLQKKQLPLSTSR